MKIAIGVEYNGQAFHGWQKQSNNPETIQQALEMALSKVADYPITTICAGRTDAGVHATGQVVHFETDADRKIDAWMRGTNTHLPRDVRVVWAKEVADDFHARFSATARRYHYVIYNSKAQPAILHSLVTWEARELNAGAMQEAANYLLGKHDFSSFRAKDCQSHSANRVINHIQILKRKQYVIIDIKANAFLHHMVRNIAGVLMPIGLEQQDPQWADEVLKAKDRNKAGVTAPGTGLYLIEVDYPEQYKIPNSSPMLFMGED